MFSYSTTFILDRPYYTECFEESVVIEPLPRRYAKAYFFGIVGVLFTHINEYASWFIFALGIIEALSIYYRKPWWVMRQMLSRAAKSEVTLTINETGISSQSFYLQSEILWQQISSIKATKKGWLLIHNKGTNYLSNQFLSTEALNFLTEKAATVTHSVPSE